MNLLYSYFFCTVLSIVDFSIMHQCNNFGMWTVNKKSEECVTFHSDFLEMSYKLNIKIKCVVPLLLGDAKNFLIPPRIPLVYRSVRVIKLCDKIPGLFDIGFACLIIKISASRIRSLLSQNQTNFKIVYQAFHSRSVENVLNLNGSNLQVLNHGNDETGFFSKSPFFS